MNPYYERSGITIWHGDCREVLPTLAAATHVITDPPFARDVYRRLGMPNTHKGSETPKRLGNAHHGEEPRERAGQSKARFGDRPWTPTTAPSIEKLQIGAIGYIDDMLDAVAVELARLTARWSLVFSDIESCHLWRLALEKNGMRYVRTGAWVKTDPMPQFSGDRPAVGFEPCTITHAKGPMRWNGGGHAATWAYGTVKTDRPAHPCPKPLPLMRELVSLFTDTGETILDPFMGSGTTLRAAKDLGRRCIGIELEEKYCEIAAQRLEQEVMALEVAK